MVVKPLSFVHREGGSCATCRQVPRQGILADYLRSGIHKSGESGKAAPAWPCSKRSLALREFALGIEALERFVRMEPLRRVHECVFGVLALESEPVDPRL